MEHSDIADAKIRLFNADGSESATAGNALRCMGKYLYDNGLVKKEDMRIETGAGVREVHLYTANGLVTSACVDMAAPLWMRRPSGLPSRKRRWWITRCISADSPSTSPA